MSDPTVVRIEARVHENERPGMLEAAAQLRDCLARAATSAAQFRIDLAFAQPGQAPGPMPAPTLVVLSLLPELERADEPVADIARRWLRDVRALQEAGAPVYVRNIFRHARDRARDGRPTPVLDRIRRLNRMAIEVSRETGAAVIDIDRAFADVGGRDLDTDYRMEGPLAAALAGHATVLSLLSLGLDDVVDPAVQEKAKTFHGGLREARAAIRQRITSS